MKTLNTLILALLLTTIESNATFDLFWVKDCIGKIDCPIKKIKTKEIGENIYVEAHINTLSDKVSKGIKLFEFRIKDSKNPDAPPIYSFSTEQRLDVVVTFSFRKEKIWQIEGQMSLWGLVLHETAVEPIKSYIFEIKDYLKTTTKPATIDNKKPLSPTKKNRRSVNFAGSISASSSKKEVTHPSIEGKKMCVQYI